MCGKAGLLLAMTLLTCFPSASQYKPRPVVGLVTDKRGNTLPGAIVQIENTRTLAVRSYITKIDGRYQFSESMMTWFTRSKRSIEITGPTQRLSANSIDPRTRKWTS
jgi:hypothetical protein